MRSLWGRALSDYLIDFVFNFCFLLAMLFNLMQVSTFKKWLSLSLLLCSLIINAQTFSFTPAGASGRFGPTQTQINAAYLSTNLNNSVVSNNGIQTFTIPSTGLYRIQALGAKGGNGYVVTGGSGAKMQGDFYLTAGQVLKILVGQTGLNGTCGGGGGGSFVTYTNNVPLCIAGAGGGGAYLNMYSFGGSFGVGSIGLSGLNGVNGNYSITAGLGGLSGNGGTTVAINYTPGVGSAGGGLLTNGANGSITIGGGMAFVNGGNGGAGASSTVGIGGDGGFGGGGGADWSNSTGSGGAGGYSGGGAGVHFGWGGAGGSINHGANQVNVAGFNGGPGLVTITNLLSGVAIAQTAPVACNGMSTAVLSATPVGGQGPYTYSWSPGGSTLSTLSGLGTGTYVCTVTDALSASMSSSFVVATPGTLVASIASQSNVTCAGGFNGQCTPTITGGTFPFTYSWVPSGGTGPIGTGLSAGNYTCYIADAYGCSTTLTTSITQATTVLNIGILFTATSICTGSFVNLVGQGGYSYTWTGGITNGTAFYPTSSGGYTVTGFDQAGCSSTAAIHVNVNPAPTVTISGPSSICGSGTVTLTASGANSYSWLGISSSPSIVVSPTSTTNYTLVAYSLLGCSLTTIRTLSVQSSPTIQANASPTNVCAGSTVTLFGSGANSYTWSGGVVNNVAFTPSASGTYTMIGTNSCGTSTAAVTLSLLSQPSLSVSVASASLCFGNSTSLTGSGANTYTWSGGISNGSAFTPTATNTYTLVGATSCGSASTAVTVSVFPLPTITSSASTNTLCAGNPLLLTASGANSYSWTGGVINGVPFNPSVTSAYTVTGFDVNGCTNTSVRSVTVFNLPVLTTSVSNPAVCFGNSTTLYGSGAVTYTWSGGVTNNTSFVPSATNVYTLSGSNICGTSTALATVTVHPLPPVGVITSNTNICLGGTLNLQGTGAQNYVWSNGITNNVPFSPSVSTMYFVIGTDVNGCQNSSSQSITVLPSPTVSASASSTFICAGNTVALSGAGASTYSWSAGIINNLAFSPTTTSAYTVTGTATNGCQNSAVINVSVSTVPVVSALASSSAVCIGNNITLFGSGANTYTWSGGISNNVAFSPTSTSNYTVNGSNSCGTGSAAITVSVNALPTVFAIASPPSVCVGNSVTLLAGGAITFTWSGGILNNSPFTPSATTAYTVTGTNINGCQNTAVQTVTVNPLPALTANASNSQVCIGNTVTLTGGGANTYTWSGGISNGISFSPTITTTYSVIGTNTVTGCTNTVPAIRTLTVNPLPIITATASVNQVCLGQSAQLNGGGATNYNWSGGVTNNLAFQPSATAVYTVSGTNTVTGCSGANTATVQIVVNALPTVSASVNTAVICFGNSVTLSGSGANTYTWSGGVLNGIPFAPNTSGNYSLAGTSTLTGCTSTNLAVQSITVNALPNLSVSSSNGAVCAGNTVALVASNANTYTWSAGLINGQSFTPSATAIYTVSGTNTITGCSNTTTQQVLVYARPTISVSVSSLSVCSGNTLSLLATGANSYNWSNGVVNGQSFIPTASAAYSVSGTSSLGGCSSTNTLVIAITVYSLPVINVAASTSLVCAGSTLSLLASGANTYVWSNGINNGTSFTPTASSIYTCIGTNTVTGCSNTVTQSITLQALPVLSISTSTNSVCMGQPVTLVAAGADTYTWSGGINNNVPFTPSLSTTFSVSGTNTLTGCTSTALAIQSITVLALPTLSIQSTSLLLCVGESVTITASGASSYTWQAGQTTPQIIESPTVTSIYTLTGLGQNGCYNTTAFTQSVSECVSITEASQSVNQLLFYPNPSRGALNIQSNLDLKLRVYSEIGQLVRTLEVKSGIQQFDLSGLANGIYFVMGQTANFVLKEKIILDR
jgi:hypothetical protein